MVESLYDTQEAIIEWYKDHGLMKTAYYPICEEKEATEMKICKFGGAEPYLPGDENHFCPHCHGKLEVILQAYVPLLPDTIKKILEPRHQESIIVLLYCLECLEPEYQIVFRAFTPEQIPLLKYREVPESFLKSSVFSSFKTVPSMDSTSDSFYELTQSINPSNSDALVDGARFIEEELKCYFGGYPFYIQGDENPGSPFKLFLNLDEDQNFTFMWGDCGTAQVWYNPESDRFYITWACG